MSSRKFQKPIRIKGHRLVLTKKMIEDAQSQTKSNMAAARWLGVSYNTYKKWAKYYDVFDQHKNQSGVGIKKGWASYKIPIDDIIKKTTIGVTHFKPPAPKINIPIIYAAITPLLFNDLYLKAR